MLVTLDENNSTTRRVVQAESVVIAELIKQSAKPEDQFEAQVFLPVGENRQGEGGLRTQGYFKVGGLISENIVTANGACHSDATECPSESSSCHSDQSEQSPNFLPLTSHPSPDSKPLITVVTVVYNGEQFLEETILSVINQTYDNVEYIIIDGGSTDGTLDIIKKYEHAIDYWVSEKDKGIYDAMNRGIDLATGEWINFMNAGDVFASSKVIHPIFTTEKIDNASLVFGKSITFYQNLEVLRYEDFNSTNKKFYLTKMPNHQAVFVQKCIYKKIKYNLSYKFFADTVYLRECFSQAEFYEFSGVVSRFELGGVSSFYGKYSNFIGLVKDSQILTGKKISPFIKHFVKYTMQKILGKDLYLKFYIKRVL